MALRGERRGVAAWRCGGAAAWARRGAAWAWRCGWGALDLVGCGEDEAAVEDAGVVQAAQQLLEAALACA